MSKFWAGGRRSACTAAATLFITAGLTVLIVGVTGPQPPPVAPDTARTAHADGHRAPTPAPHGPPLPRSEPVDIAIPEIGLRTRVEGVAQARDGAVAMPADPHHAGWYTGSVTPGENGNTVLVGHLDSPTGPAAFYGLGALRNGDPIHLTRRDGTTATYTVDGMAVWPKSDLPSQDVYAPTLHPRLTLITCADWDDTTHTYRSNLVITAHR